MLVDFLIEIAVGILLIVLGLLIWLKQKITMLHKYHYQNVSDDDIASYTKYMGIGIIVMGIGIIVDGICLLVEQHKLGLLCLVIGFMIGIVILHMTQRKYNGSWFS